jgi:hypothetical protein
VEFLLEDSQGLGRGDDGKRFEIVAQDTGLELLGRVLDPAVFLLLLEIRFLIGRPAKAEALLHRSRSVGLDVPILALGARLVRLRSEIDLILVPVIAEEEHLASVGDQDQCIVGKGHERFLLTRA